MPPLLLLPPSHDKKDATTAALASSLLWQLLAGGGSGAPDGDATETQERLSTYYTYFDYLHLPPTTYHQPTTTN